MPIINEKSEEFNTQYNNVLAIWYKLYQEMVNRPEKFNFRATRILAECLIKEIEILQDIEAIDETARE